MAVKDDLLLAQKNNDAVEKFLREHEHILQLYETLCIALVTLHR